MPITETAPYAPADGIIAVLEKYRETGLGGSPITPTVVQRMSKGEEIARRVVLSLKQLELIDDDGVPTPTLEAFKKAPSTEYKRFFANHLYDVYSIIFAVLGQNIDGKTNVEVEDAFRDLKPDSLRKRMVTCFLGLCGYAGIVDESRIKPGPKSTSKPTGTPTRKKLPQHRKPVAPATTTTTLPPPLGGASAVATLESGGTVTLTVSVSVVDMSAKDRNFVFDLIDKVKGYGKAPELAAGSPNPDGVSTS